jgi:uncharacterized membrane protein (DUF4010 family)
MDRQHLWSFVVALFIGALIGTERTLRHRPERGDFAGLRTFILLAQAGAVTAWIARNWDEALVFVVGMASTALLLSTAYFIRSRNEADPPGYTTELAGGTVFLLGGAAVLGYEPFAVAMAIVTSGVLALKDQLHASVRKLNSEELLAALRLLFASFVVLPVLPHEPVDPWGALDPYELWLLVILISGLSMAGYVAVRWTGARRGTLLTGVLGGLVSSTAVTISLARRSREVPAMASVSCAGIALSWAVMFVRVAVEVAVVFPSLLARLGPPLGALALGLGLIAFGFARRAAVEDEGASDDALVALRNPFRLRAAVQFAALFAVVLLAAKFASLWLPSSGLYALAVLSGAVDVDAITLSVAGMAQRSEITPRLATNAIVLATATNSAMKLVYAMVLGHAALRRRLILPGAFVLLAGAIALAA